MTEKQARRGGEDAESSSSSTRRRLIQPWQRNEEEKPWNHWTPEDTVESTLHRVEKALWRKLCSTPEADQFFCGCGCLHVPAHGLRTTCDCECSWASHMLGRCPADTDDLIAAWDAAPAAWDPDWPNAPQWPMILGPTFLGPRIRT